MQAAHNEVLFDLSSAGQHLAATAHRIWRQISATAQTECPAPPVISYGTVMGATHGLRAMSLTSTHTSMLNMKLTTWMGISIFI